MRSSIGAAIFEQWSCIFAIVPQKAEGLPALPRLACRPAEVQTEQTAREIIFIT
jgi:hypothetical protein